MGNKLWWPSLMILRYWTWTCLNSAKSCLSVRTYKWSIDRIGLIYAVLFAGLYITGKIDTIYNLKTKQHNLIAIVFHWCNVNHSVQMSVKLNITFNFYQLKKNELRSRNGTWIMSHISVKVWIPLAGWKYIKSS